MEFKIRMVSFFTIKISKRVKRKRTTKKQTKQRPPQENVKINRKLNSSLREIPIEIQTKPSQIHCFLHGDSIA